MARSDRLGHLVVDLEDQALGAVLAMRRLVQALQDGERGQGVVDFATGEPVSVKQ